VGGVGGGILGACIFAELYPKLEEKVLKSGEFWDATFPEILGVNSWLVVIPAVLILIGLLFWIEGGGALNFRRMRNIIFWQVA